MAFFKQYCKVNEQIKVEFAYMRVVQDGHHINALAEFWLRPRLISGLHFANEGILVTHTSRRSDVCAQRTVVGE